MVALGASAGGLEALRQLFAHLPADTGLAFVVIQHLDPDRQSMLTKVLQGVTELQVVEARKSTPVVANCVHVISHDSDLRIEGGILLPVERQLTGRLHLPIDSFLRSLAEDGKARAVGVVLSGSGADGTEGLRAIKADGGIAIAQDPDSALFRSMPESAIAAGVVDFIGSPEDIAAELVRLSRHPYLKAPRGVDEHAGSTSKAEESLSGIFAALRQQGGTDFSGYKRNSILRRIERRMTLRHVDQLEDYAVILREDPIEVRALMRDMLIHVTSFFREPAAFEALGTQVFAELARRKQDGGSIRVWIPGCSTGEEAYSVAICLLETLGDRIDAFTVQVFGTDLDSETIDLARQAVYSEASLAGVAPEQLARFFERVEDGYRISKIVRDLCIFVKHDLTRDPPFAKLDLISCRNVLIYFDAELQRRILPLLHYCLNEQGYLFLGRSETITGFRDLFAPVDKEHRIFVKTGDSPRLPYPLPASREAESKLAEGTPVERRHPVRDAQRQADHLLLARYAPPGVVVNERLEIVQFRGRTGAYLEPPPGQPQASLLRMVREDLVAHVHEATERAKAQSATARTAGLRIQVGGEARTVDLEVIPLAAAAEATERYFLVLFEEAGTRPGGQVPSPSTYPGGAREIGEEAERLKSELVATKDYLQSLMSENQVTTDDLAATSEEMVAANEELQSANEELQSAKEELQATNEELSTVNDQLRNRNQELDQIASDLVNVLSSVEIPIIIVDLALRVRRFTPALSEVASFIPEDVGRPIEDLKLRIVVDDLATRIRGVIDSMAPRDWEVQAIDGRWLRMQIRPYRTTDHRLDGAVLSFVDVDVLRRANRDAERARDYARSIVETVSTSLVVLDAELRVVSVNGAFLEKFALAREAVEGKCLFELGSGLGYMPDMRRLVEQALAEQEPFTSTPLAMDSPRAGRKAFSLTGRLIPGSGSAPMLLLAIDDVTELRLLEAERAQILASEKEARIEAERATRAKDVFLAVLSHELRTPLSTILMSSQMLKQVSVEDPKLRRAGAFIERAVNAQARLINDLLDVSRIVSGKLLLDLGPVDIAAVVQESVDEARPTAQAKALAFELEIVGAIGIVYGDALRLHQVVNNLLSNAIKFTPHGGHVQIRLERIGEQAHLTVSDTGMGISPDVLPQLFSRYIQADSSVTRTHGGLGLGLAIVSHLVEVHGGEVLAESEGVGKGATFRVTLPLGGSDASTEPVAQRTLVKGVEGVRVLLVEDDDDNRDAYALMLEEFGAVVRAVGSAAAGLAALETFHPQVILSDVAMPGVDGCTFIQQVRRLPAERGGRVPAAAITALASDEDRNRALQSGFQMHVAKPVGATRLASIVSTLVEWKPLEI